MIDVNKQVQETLISVSGTNRITVANSSELKEAIVETLQRENQSVLLDLEGIKYMDSTAISVLISGVKVARETNLNFTVRNVQDEVLKLLKLMKIDRILTIC